MVVYLHSLRLSIPGSPGFKQGCLLKKQLPATLLVLLGFAEAHHHSLSHLRWVAAIFSHLGHHVLHHP
jgi:hypothetical protein